MRRFIGYISIAITLIIAVVFNLSLQTSSLNTGLEYGPGYEAVYRVDFEESTKSLNDIVEILTQRVEDAGVRNANIEAVSDEHNDEYQVRIKANSINADTFDYVLRSVESTGTISVSTILDDKSADELTDPFVRGSAKVEWSGSTPYVSVEIKDYDRFSNFVENCNESYKSFLEEYPSDSENATSLEGVIIIWLDKTNDDNYERAFYDENEVVQQEIKDKILSIIPTTYFEVEEDSQGNKVGATLIIDRYDFSQNQMVGESAHTIERLLNYEPQDYSLDKLYIHRVGSTYSDSSYNILLIGLGIAVCLISVYLIASYGIDGLGGIASFLSSLFLSLLVFNFFNYPITTMVFLAFAISLIINMCFIVPILETYKDEIYKGKSPVKANQEAFKVTSMTALDTLFATLAVSVITLLVSINQVKLLPISVTISVITAYISVRLLMKLMMWWLANSKVAENKKLFFINEELVPNLSKDDVQKKFNFMHKFDANKYGKPVAIITSIVSLVALLSIVVMSVIPGIGTFNYTSEFNTRTRIEITTEVDSSRHLFETKSSVVEFFESNYNLTPSEVYINVVENVVNDSSNYDYLPTVAYISVGFDDIVNFTDVEFEQLEANIRDLDYGEDAVVYYATSNSTMPTFVLSYSILTLVLFGLIPSLYYLIRFRFSYGIASFITVAPAALIAVSLFTLVRIPTSPLVLMGIAGGILLSALTHIPLFNKVKKLTRESKAKVVTFDQRKTIILKANSESLHLCVKLSLLAIALVIFIAFFVPAQLVTVIAGMFVSLSIASLLTCYLLTPVYLVIENKYYQMRLNYLSNTKEKRESKGKKRLQKIKEAHKKVGSEPEESIIPGIND